MDLLDKFEDDVMVSLRDARVALSEAKSGSVVGDSLIWLATVAVITASVMCEVVVRVYFYNK
ncbi:MAG: hypothetical protein ACRDBF_16520 [Plesiomonas shigelloides]